MSSKKITWDLVEKTTPMSQAFAGLATVAAEWDSEPATLALHRGFERIIQKYRQERGFGGHHDPRPFDFSRFVGHELFMTLVAVLMREGRWESVARLLDEGLHVDNHPDGRPELVTFEYVGQSVEFYARRDRSLSRYKNSTHAEVLRARHTDGELGRLVPLADFVSADILLGLRSAFGGFHDEDSFDDRWIPVSARHLHQVPKFLIEAKQARHAERLLKSLGVPDIPMLRQHLIQHLVCMRERFGHRVPYGLTQIDPESIGTR